MGATNDAVNLILRGEPFRNFCHSFYDDFVEQNVEFRHRAGVKSLVIRRNLGGSCDWCKNLAGIYTYGKEPGGIWQRHDSCRCLITTKYEKSGYIDAYSKEEYATQKEARIARLKNIENEKKEEAIHQKAIRNALAKGKRCADVTEYWRKRTKPTAALVRELKRYTHNGKQYSVNEDGVIFEPSISERVVANLIAEEFGGIVDLVPKIIKPEGQKTPDYLFNGIKYDLKEVTGSSKNVIGNAIGRKKWQSKGYIIDITNCPLEEDALFKQAESVFGSYHLRFVEEIIIIKRGKVLKVYERVKK